METQNQQPTSDDITQDGQQNTQQTAVDDQQPENQEGQENQAKDEKPELTPAEKEARALKRRIDRLTRNKYQSEAQMQQMQAELTQLRAQLGQGGDDPQAPAAPKPADLQRQAREMVEIERINARCDDVVAKGEASYADFGEKVRELGQELPLFDQHGRPNQVLQAILDADDPAALIYHLGSNPDTAAELADMTPRQQMRHLIKIEAQIGKPSDPPATPTVSKAPPPVQPNRSASGQFSKDPEKMTDEEWWEHQKSQQSKR